MPGTSTTHMDGDPNRRELRSRILNNYDIDFHEKRSSFSKQELYKIAKITGSIKRGRCYFCEEDDSTVLEEHHIIPRRYGGTNQGQNIVTLCSNCHKKLESLYDDRIFFEIAGQINEESSKNELQKKKEEVLGNAFD